MISNWQSNISASIIGMNNKKENITPPQAPPNISFCECGKESKPKRIDVCCVKSSRYSIDMGINTNGNTKLS